jgi:hypothetical protein
MLFLTQSAGISIPRYRRHLEVVVSKSTQQFDTLLKRENIALSQRFGRSWRLCTVPTSLRACWHSRTICRSARAARTSTANRLAYVCRNSSCKAPLITAEALRER